MSGARAGEGGLNRAIDRARATWEALPPARRGMAVGALVVAAIGLSLVGHRATQPELVLLYGGLELEESGRIAAALRERKVAFQVGEGGRIEVPRERVDELRVELAMQGLPRGGVGYELFDHQSPFGLSEFSERVAFERARAGELSRTIGSLEQVERASVHVVEPQKSLFLQETTPPRASVVLRLHPGARLAHAQVEGIARIVAGAVAGLALEDVSVVDERGNPLGALEGRGGLSGALELQRSVEESLVRKAQQVLLAVAGPRGAVVQVSAELDLDRVEETIEKFDAESRVPRHETSRTRERQGPSSQEGGTGAASKLSGQGPKGSTGERETEETSETDYLVPHSVQQLLRASGGVKRLSVALLVDEGEKERLGELTKLVKRAIGFDDARGDAFEAVATALDPGELAVAPGFTFTPQLVGRLVEAGVSALAVVALVLVARSLRPKPVQPDEEEQAPQVDPELELERKRAEAERQRRIAEFERETREREHLELVNELHVLVREHPKIATQVLRAWLYEDVPGHGAEEEDA